MYTHSCRCAHQDFAAAGPCRKARSSDVFRALDPPSDTRQAICALAALVLLDWMLQDVWSIPFHGLELSLDFGGIEVFFHHFVFPAAAIAGAALALQGPEAGARRPAGQPANADQLDRRRRLHHRNHYLRVLSGLLRARTTISY